MAEERECLDCGKKFIPTCHITRQKFCIDICRYRYNNAKRHYEVPVNVCPACEDVADQRECRPIAAEEPEKWREKLTEATRAAGDRK